MHVYVELWNANPTWLSMSRPEREAFISKVKEAIGGMEGEGIQLLHFAVADEDVAHDAGYRYIAEWTMPDRDAAVTLEKGAEAAGFHELFDQVNARGKSISPDALFEDMIAA